MHAIVASHTSYINTSIDRQLLFLSLHISTPRIHNSPSTRPLSFTPPPSLSLSLSHTLSLISPQRHTSSFHASSPHTYSHIHTTHISSLFLFPPSPPYVFPSHAPGCETSLSRSLPLSLSRFLSRSLLSHFCCWILNLPTVFALRTHGCIRGGIESVLRDGETLWDDGIIDPRDTRQVLGMAIEAAQGGRKAEPRLNIGVMRL